MKRLFSQLSSIILAVIIVYGFLSIRPYAINGDSMQPGLVSGQIILVDRFSSRVFPLKRGEIIVYTDMDSEEKIKIKRVLGLPGESLTIQGGEIYLDKSEISLQELYLSTHVRTCAPGSCVDTNAREYEVPGNAYFVLGDYRESSVDSRGCDDPTWCEKDAVKYIPKQEVVGRMIMKF